MVLAVANYQGNVGHTNAIEHDRRLAAERVEICRMSVADLEKKLSITLRWEQDDLAYQEAVKKCNKCKYQLAVNHLESLVVAWLFELVKMNHGRTGMLTNLHYKITVNLII